MNNRNIEEEAIAFFELNKKKIISFCQTDQYKIASTKLSSLDAIIYFQKATYIIRKNYEMINDITNFSFKQLKAHAHKHFKFLKFIERILEGHYDFNVYSELKIELTDKVIKYLELTSNFTKEIIRECGFIIQNDKLEFIKTTSLKNLEESNPIKQYLSSNSYLFKLNKLRKRNVILFDNGSQQVVYDLYSSSLFISTKIPFSDFEHDTNRKFTEEVCVNFLFNFNENKEYYLKLLRKNKKLYMNEIDFVTGKAIPNEEEITVLISLLGRLVQQNKFGPITTFRKEKLNPKLISKHTTNLHYIKETINTLVNYQKLFINKVSQINEIPHADFDLLKIDEISNIQGDTCYLPLNNFNLKPSKIKVSTNKVKGNIKSPNYLESFFRKFVNLPEYSGIIPFFNSQEDMSELIMFSKRFRGKPKQPDFIISAKMRAILNNTNIENLKSSVLDVFNNSKKNTYSYQVANFLIEQDKNMLKNIYELYFLFHNNIEREKERFKNSIVQLENSDYNNEYLSICSDMHFHKLDYFEKFNFSTKFNIVAGDFVDNLYHRGNINFKGESNIKGVGVLGNHDIYLGKNPNLNLENEIKTNYKKSISILNSHFSKIKILNDEILYKDGYAIIGLSLFYDMKKGVKSLFAKDEWGVYFKNDNYIERSRVLLNKVPKDVPIIFITHSPFKEYSVSNNKNIGVPSNMIFKDYPNVKIYIHGHGHSNSAKKVIEGILCISNPIVINESISKMTFTRKHLNEVLGIDSKKLLN